MTGGHGWVVPNPDGSLAKCGGPLVCAECASEKAQYNASRIRVADMIAPAVSDAQDLVEHMALVRTLTRGMPMNVTIDNQLAAIEASARRLMGLNE